MSRTRSDEEREFYDDVARAPTVLVVDDDPSVLDSISRMLQSAGFERPLVTQDPEQIPRLMAGHLVRMVLLDLVHQHKVGTLMGNIC